MKCSFTVPPVPVPLLMQSALLGALFIENVIKNKTSGYNESLLLSNKKIQKIKTFISGLH